MFGLTIFSRLAIFLENVDISISYKGSNRNSNHFLNIKMCKTYRFLPRVLSIYFFMLWTATV